MEGPTVVGGTNHKHESLYQAERSGEQFMKLILMISSGRSTCLGRTKTAPYFTMLEVFRRQSVDDDGDQLYQGPEY